MDLVVRKSVDLHRLRTAAGRRGIRSISISPFNCCMSDDKRTVGLVKEINHDLNVCGCIPASIALVISICVYMVTGLSEALPLADTALGKIACGFGVAVIVAAITKVMAIMLAALRLQRNITCLGEALSELR